MTGSVFYVQGCVGKLAVLLHVPRASRGAGHSPTRFLLYIDFNSVLEIVLWIEYN